MPKTMRQACAALLLAISVSLSAPACGARIDPNATPQQVEQAQLRDLQRVAQVVERVGNLVLALQNAEIALHRAGRISQGTHESIQTYLKISAEFVIAELEGAKDATKSPLERRHGIMRALKFIDGLQTGLIDKIPDEEAKTRLGLFVMSIQTLLTVWQLVADAVTDVFVDVARFDAIIELCATMESPRFSVTSLNRLLLPPATRMWWGLSCTDGSSTYRSEHGVFAVPIEAE